MYLFIYMYLLNTRLIIDIICFYLFILYLIC